MNASRNVTKAEMIDRVMEKTGLSKKEVKAAFESFIDTIIDAVAEGNRIELRGFGVFNHKLRQPRMARNPKTGDQVKMEKRVVPVFKPSPDFQDKVNDRLKK
jgi:integration host factor beta subunit